MLHVKLMIVDDLWVSIGSANLDNRSFRINDEANMNVLDPGFAAEQVRLFEADLACCRRITYKDWAHRPWIVKLLDGISTWFDPLL
jgi:cardiolipin synthase